VDGSQSSNVNEMVNAFNSAITAQAKGIGVCLVDLKAFNGPTDKALAAKIPVVGYNADAAGNNRLAYIGQDLFVSGQRMGDHIVELVPSGDVALFIATPGSRTSSRASTARRTPSRRRARGSRPRDRHRRRPPEGARRSTPTGRATRTRRDVRRDAGSTRTSPR
jgi:simple sugar transport system substrate-binding protein